MPELEKIVSRAAPSSQSDVWRERADLALAGKQSNFRPGPALPPLIVDRSEGVRIFDVDGNDYIDFVLGMGPAILGHSNPEIAAAVKNQIDNQFSSASAVMHTTQEIELAERITKYVPCADKVRFGLSGTEADQLAMRVARGVTGRRFVVRCEGHYHGWLDNVFGGNLEDGNAGHPVQAKATGAGVAPHAFADILMCPWNDADALERLFEARGDEIAMVIMEAVLCNNGCCPPRPGYLQKVRELCTKHGVILCFDEVITGFRMDIGGAQQSLGVTPDLAVFGKALAGGLPLSAIAGRDDVMKPLKDNVVLGGGTFNSFPLAMASGLATIAQLERNSFELYDRIDHVQEKIAQGLRDAARNHGFDLLVQGPRGFLFFAFTNLDIAYTPADIRRSMSSSSGGVMDQGDVLGLKFRGFLEQEGVLVAGGSRLVISPVMSDGEVGEAVHRFDRAMKLLADSQ